MGEFLDRLKQHSEHVKAMHSHCATEETTKQALVLPLLDILGFSPYDPTKVKAEYFADFAGVKAQERVDYALYCNNSPVIFIEAKSVKEPLTNHAPQLSRYFNCTVGMTIGVITNGIEWRFFTDLQQPNIMDNTPFLVIDFIKDKPKSFLALSQFAHDKFEAQALRNFAEESLYINGFKTVINSCLRDIDMEFVRFVATKSDVVQRQLSAKFLETIQPLVKNAVEQSISEMIVSSLSAPQQVAHPPSDSSKSDGQTAMDEEPDYFIDPNNPKIITTKDEMNFFDCVCDVLIDEDIQAKDTESYFSVLYNGRNNRWIVRYNSNRKRHTIEFPLALDQQKINEIERAGFEHNGSIVFIDSPTHITRLAGILRDSLNYCKNDDNFRRQRGEKDEV